MEISNIALLAAGGSIGAFWGQIKIIFNRFSSFFIKKHYVDNSVSRDVIDFLLKNGKLLKFGNTSYRFPRTYIVDDYTEKDKKSLIPTLYALMTYDSYIILYKNLIPILISKSDDMVCFTFLVKTMNFNPILNNIILNINDDYIMQDKITNGHFSICEESGKDTINVSKSKSNNSNTPPIANSSEDTYKNEKFDNIAWFKEHSDVIGEHSIAKYMGEGRNTIVGTSFFWSKDAIQLDYEISFWLNSRDFYKKRKITWKRGILLSGKPGTGKSKMIVQCAEKNKIPILKLNISNMSDDEFVCSYKRYISECNIILIEDIDAVFNKRENILNKNNHNKQLLSFDTLINTINGITTLVGKFLIITTNKPELLDEALKREGRLDKHIEVGNICKEGRYFIANNILFGFPELIEQVVNECEECSAAKFENLCIEKAINKYHEENYKP